jgi:glycosyltransferase involved in cell wall biosynthesis
MNKKRDGLELTSITPPAESPVVMMNSDKMMAGGIPAADVDYAAARAVEANPVSEARRRVDDLPGIRRTIAVILMWPEQACAEHECVERLRTAAELIGVKVIELDKFGHIVGTPRQRVAREDVDFVIHLHYETAKTYDAVSVAAMWNPTQFYFDWGFDRHWSNQMSHDIYAYTGSPEIKKLVRASRGDFVAADMPLLNHTLADPIIPPRIHDEYRVFYCGINWEKLTNKPARHDAILRELDKKGVLDVYGPTEIRGVKLWDGYEGYRGSLPFDGRTIIGKIADAGACLVFSSEAHINSGIMSSRLFEAMAAGAVVIGDEHPFLPAAIGDNYIRVPATLPAEERAKRIVEALERFGRDPQEAFALASASQRAMLESYHLCTQLANVYEAAHRFSERSRALTLPSADPVVDLVVQPLYGDANVVLQRVNGLAKSFQGRARITALVDPKLREWYEGHVDSTVQIVSLPATQSRILGPMECFELAGNRLTCPKVTFLLGIEEVFPETFAAACIEAKGHPVARVGHVLRHRDKAGNVFYDYFRGAGDLNTLRDPALGCVIFDRDWLANRVPLRTVSWKDLCRMAILERQTMVECPTTAIVIDITDYEQIIHRYALPKAVPLDIETMSRLSGSVQESISSGAIVAACRPAAVTAEPVRGLSAGNLIETVHGMDQEQRWRLMLDLYHSIPLPRWTRRFLTFIRKSIGIK